MSKFRSWIPNILCLLVLWVGVVAAIRIVSSGKPTAATTLALLESSPDAAANEKSRHEWIDLIASRLAALDLDSRHLVLMEPRLRSAFIEMSPEDQSYFLQATEQSGMPAFLDGTKVWNRGRYERLLQPARSDLEQLKDGSSDRMTALLTDPETWNETGRGIESIFKNPAAALTRFDTRPLIERVRKYSEFGR